MRRAWWCLLPSLTACGAEPQPAALVLELPFLAQIDPCTHRDDLGQNMEAAVLVGGHEECPLTVDPATLVARGECSRITIGIVRPIGLSYWYPDPNAGSAAALAYLISWVDLRKETLADDTTSVSVQMDTDPVTGNAFQVETDAEVLALPLAADCATLEGAERNLCTSKAWARIELNDSLVTFDRDGDDEINLQEACDGNLWL